MNKSRRNDILLSIAIALITIILGLLIGFVLILITTGTAGITDFVSSIYDATFASLKSFGNWIYFGIPLILCGLSVAFAYRVGLFNIGAEGQFIVASFTAIFLGYHFDFPGSAYVVIVLASCAAMIYALIPGLLKAYYGISEVVVTIMLNWIALIFVNQYLIPDLFHPENKITQTKTISENSSLTSDFFSELTNGSYLNIGILLTILAVIVYFIVMEKTRFGYELKAVGYSPFAADYAGIKSKKNIVYSMMISGFFAGLAGAIFSLGNPGYLTVTTDFRNYGFDGIAVAMLGQLNGMGIFFSGLLFSGLRQSEAYMTQVPNEVVDIIIAVIVICSAFGAILKAKISKKVGDKK